MKIIRWWGVVAFVVLLVLSLLSWYLLAPIVIASSIEELGSESLGAKVEVKQVELSLFPVAVNISALQAADPEQPMKNIFESESIKFSLDVGALLWKKIIIEELTISGVKSGTARTTSGALPGGRKSGQLIEKVMALEIPDVNDIDVDKLVEEADLVTPKRIETLTKTQQRLRSEWQQALNKEDFDKRIEEIKLEYERLSQRARDNKLNLLKDRKKWKKLKKLIDAERQQIAQLSTKVKQDKALLKNEIEAVKRGPKDDLQRVMQRFGLGNGIAGLVDQYLGPQYTPWITRALTLINSVNVNSGDTESDGAESVLQVGQRVYFDDHQVFPEVLIKKLILAGSDDDWRLDGKGIDLGYLPWLTGNPARLNIQLEGAKQASLKVHSDWPSDKQMKTSIDTSIERWPVSAMPLMETQEGAWILDSGVLSASISGEITMQAIDLRATFSVSKPQVNIPENIADWQKSLANSISVESKIDFEMVATGPIEQPKISLTSNIEKLFQQAIGEKVKQKASQMTGKIQQSIDQQIGDITNLDNLSGDFQQWQSQLGGNDQLLKDLLGKLSL